MWSKQKSPRFAVEKPANPAGEPCDFLGVLVAVLPTSSWQAAENTKMTVVELKLSWITLKCKEVSSFPELEEESTEPPFELFGNVWKYHSFPLENSSQHHSKILSPSHPHSCHHCPEIGPGYYDLPSLLDEHSVTITASERFQARAEFWTFFLGQRMVWLLQLIC